MRKNNIILLLMMLCPLSTTNAQTLGKGLMSIASVYSQEPRMEARVALRQDNVEQALILYAKAVTQAQKKRNGGHGVDGELLAEYAYTLALHHDFEGALVNIDRARMLNAKCKDFYAGHILSTMKYQSAADLFLKDAKTPTWMDATSFTDLTIKHAKSASIISDTPQEALKRANQLAANRQTIQAIALFEELSFLYPDVYIIPNSYATVWESIGRFDVAAQLLKKGIGLMTDTEENKPTYEKHLQKVEQAVALSQKKWMRTIMGMAPPKMMTYVGGSVAKDYYSLDGKIGLYTNNRFSASANLGLSYGSKSFMGNIGLSAYKTWNIFIVGLGVNDQFGKDSNTFSLNPSVGLSFMNKKQTSSFDIIFGGYIPCTSGSKFSYSLSIGKTIYIDVNSKKK